MGAKKRTYHVGFSRNSRHDDTVALFRELTRRGFAVTPHLIEQDWQAKRVGEMDAVLVGGGADIHPSLYGERNWGCGRVDRSRDRLESVMIESALSNGVPLMGICRGMQLINVILGGTLHQDMGQDLGVWHRPQHKIASDDCLDAVLPVGVVNSTHHQCVRVVGEGMEVLASAPDGVPELIWSPGILGVQFHPESLAIKDPRWLDLFAWWLAGARMRADTV